MLKTTSQEFRTFFLLEFTSQLIKNSTPEEVLKLETIVNEEKKQKEENKKGIPQKIILQRKTIIPPRKIVQFKQLPRPLTFGLRMQPLPQRLQYLRPIPKEVNIELGKLNELVNDYAVTAIECDGPEKNILVSAPNSRVTNIILNEDEIKSIIEEFSKISRIPLEEGIYKVAAGRLILLAAISEIVGTKFIIKKIPFMQQNLIPR